MAIMYTRWEKFPTTDREDLARAALDLCRVTKAQGRQSRFYWADANSICMLSEAEQPAEFFGAPSADGAKAMYTLSDLANRTGFEIWAEPRVGEQSYRLAGR